MSTMRKGSDGKSHRKPKGDKTKPNDSKSDKSEDKNKDKSTKSDKSKDKTKDESLAAATKKADGRVFRDVREWALAKRLNISQKDTEAVEYATSMGWNISVSTKEQSRAHPISHLARDVATLEVLKIEGRDRKIVKILDWYGAPRNRSLTPVFPPNGYVNVNTDRRPVWVSSRDALCVDFIAAPATPVQGDRGRWLNGPRREILDGESFDFVLVQDVYFGPRDPNGGLGPSSIRYLSNFSRDRVVYVICRMFFGDAGSDSGTLREGVWWRESSGNIVFSPDEHSAPYAAHPDCNWLQFRHFCGIDSTFLQKVGPYHLYRCVPSFEAAVPLLTQHPASPEIETREITEPGFLISILSKISALRWMVDRFGVSLRQHKVVRMPVSLKLAHSLNPIFGKRIPNGPTVDSAIYKVLAECEKDATIGALKLRFPKVCQEVIEGTILYVLYANRNVHLDAMASLRCDTAESETKLILARATANSWIAPMLASRKMRERLILFAAGSALSALGIYVGYRNRDTLKTNFARCFEPLANLWRRFTSIPSSPMSGKALAVMNSTVDSVVDDDLVALVQATQQQAQRENIEFAQGNKFYGIICAPILEETMRWCSPKLAAALCGFEVGTLWGQKLWTSAVLNACCHSMYGALHQIGWKGFVTAVLLHTGWNYMAVHDPFWINRLVGMDASVEAKPASWFDTFVSAYGVADSIQGLTLVEHLTAGTSINPYTSTAREAPNDFRGEIKVQVDQIDVTPSQALELLSQQPRELNQMYPILITNGLLWEPANNEKNLLVAILWRTHQDPFCGCDPAEQRHQRWSVLSQDFRRMEIFGRQIENVPDIEECARLMGKRGERILRADVLDQVGINMKLWKTISLKWNETLNVDKNLNGVVTMKPRAIVNLDPIIHARMAGLSRGVASLLHERLNGQVYEFYGVKVRIFFAAGYTQRQLSSIATAMQEGDVVIAISGDDSVVSWGPLTNVFSCEPYGECDQSQFDHTQDEGPQRIAASEWMRLIGIPEDFIDLCYGCCSWPYTARMGRLRVKGVAGTQMPTGITMTTVLNSMSTLFMYLWIIKTRNAEFSEAARQLGFKTKYKGAFDLGDITFLRGWWRKCADQDGRVWMPLPSACLKLGKVLRDPVDVCKYKHPVTRETVRKSGEEATRVMAYALASSYKTVEENYPILGPFLATLRRLGTEMSHPDLHSLYESQRPAMVDANIDVEDCVSATLRRYDLAVHELDRVRSLLGSVESLPAMVFDPVFERLREVDY